LQSQWYHANTFLPLKEENLYITAKITQKWLVPKCPLQRGSTVSRKLWSGRIEFPRIWTNFSPDQYFY